MTVAHHPRQDTAGGSPGGAGEGGEPAVASLPGGGDGRSRVGGVYSGWVSTNFFWKSFEMRFSSGADSMASRSAREL